MLPDRDGQLLRRRPQVVLLPALDLERLAEVRDDRLPDRPGLPFRLRRLLPLAQPLERELEQAAADVGRLYLSRSFPSGTARAPSSSTTARPRTGFPRP
jgi:hypothetical protein